MKIDKTHWALATLAVFGVDGLWEFEHRGER